jgi:hypothetical protein
MQTTTPRVLAYYTIGLNGAYCEAVRLAILSLRLFNPSFDVLVICDHQLLAACQAALSKITNIQYLPVTNSKTPEQASAHKLNVFDYPKVFDYDRVLYIDTDIVTHRCLDDQIASIVDKTKLYVYAEHTDPAFHRHRYWTLPNEYSNSTIDMFREKKINVFCAGFFAFIPSAEMKSHFTAIIARMKSHVGDFFYEQSFMNVYFNTRSLTDTSVFDSAVFQQGKPGGDTSSNEGKLVHLCGCHPGETKVSLMTQYIRANIPSLNLTL